MIRATLLLALAVTACASGSAGRARPATTTVTPSGTRTIAEPELERFRLAGARDIPLPAAHQDAFAKAGRRSPAVSFKLCVDPTGSVGSADYVGEDEIPADLLRYYVDEFKKWKFTPIEHEGRAVEVCLARMFVYQI